MGIGGGATVACDPFLLAQSTYPGKLMSANSVHTHNVSTFFREKVILLIFDRMCGGRWVTTPSLCFGNVTLRSNLHLYTLHSKYFTPFLTRSTDPLATLRSVSVPTQLERMNFILFYYFWFPLGKMQLAIFRYEFSARRKLFAVGFLYIL